MEKKNKPTSWKYITTTRVDCVAAHVPMSFTWAVFLQTSIRMGSALGAGCVTSCYLSIIVVFVFLCVGFLRFGAIFKHWDVGRGQR